MGGICTALSIDNRADAFCTLASVLSFLDEALSASALPKSAALSGEALDGLATICSMLRIFSKECAEGNFN